MFSAICIQETWLRLGQYTPLFEIPGYNLIHKGKSCNEHGGLITYLKEFTDNYRKLYNQSNLIYENVVSLLFSTNKRERFNSWQYFS